MPRTYVITGSAMGIGGATRELLVEQGARVIGVDLQDAEVVADLSSPDGRRHMIDTITEISGGRLDGVVACAGIGAWFPPEMVVSTNFFGATGTLEGLRPLLARGSDPRAVVAASFALINPCDDALVDACLDDDEEHARALAEKGTGFTAYKSSKRAIARWVRRQAPSDAWAGAGIALNAVAPGITDTPMNAKWLASDKGRAAMMAAVPMPYHGVATPRELGAAFAWLASPDNAVVTGQVLFVDGGGDCVVRGDDVWDDYEWPPNGEA